MKKLPVLFFAVIGSAFICAVTALFLISIKDKLNYTPPVSSREAVEEGYILTLCEGYVAVKRIGENTPCRVFDLPENMLSEYDRRLLKDGIFCDSLEEAERKAEDFIG